MRRDLEIIADLINPGARVLDLGCGTGDLLEYLQREKQVTGYGLDNDVSNITACLERGVNVVDYDLDYGLAPFPEDGYDMVIMTETLQAVRRPDSLLQEMLHIGRECIVTFPNFAHWRCRLALATAGRMPVSRHLPHRWFDTPNIHLCTFRDFESFCHERDLKIVERFVVNDNYVASPLSNAWPNLFGVIAYYRLGR